MALQTNQIRITAAVVWKDLVLIRSPVSSEGTCPFSFPSADLEFGMDEFEAAEMIVKTQCDGIDVRAIRWTSTYVSGGEGDVLMLCHATAETSTAPILTAWEWRTMEELERVGIPSIKVSRNEG
ncbi:hypothetical protein E4U43_008678 [Claviceps pusilla]|uniref:Uncharacterized protein n=1 Tax=Claviceps pusilla TaxID=123648 RepID=A0A9P7NB05_9HYPO|nr:hypothetical protein E4U43_008678 [Claviceps pusilla]